MEEQRKAGAERRAVGCRTLADVLAAGPGKLAGIDTAEMNLARRLSLAVMPPGLRARRGRMSGGASPGCMTGRGT